MISISHKFLNFFGGYKKKSNKMFEFVVPFNRSLKVLYRISSLRKRKHNYLFIHSFRVASNQVRVDPGSKTGTQPGRYIHILSHLVKI